MSHKVCSKCSQKYGMNVESCNLCGSELSLAEEDTLLVPHASHSNPGGDYFETGPSLAGPSGLGGWLVIVCIGLIVSLGQSIAMMNRIVPLFSEVDKLGRMFNAGFTSFLGFELVANIVTSAMIAYCLVLFFRKKKLFTAFFVITLATGFALALIDYGIAAFMFPQLKLSPSGLVGNVIKMILWIWYMKVSVRVRNTFVR